MKFLSKLNDAQSARMRSARSRMALQASPNVIPFIDVLLVLLVIFMVTAPKPTVDINVEMPQRGPVISIGRPTIVALRETAAGAVLFVDGEEVAAEALVERTLAYVLANNPALDREMIFAEGQVYVRADQSTAYGNVVGVIDTLKDGGFAQVGVFAETAQDI